MPRVHLLTRQLNRRILLAFLAWYSSPVLAQQDTVEDTAQAVVQSVPNSDSMILNAALTRLGRNPRDLEALLDAGKAALAIGDVDAAVGFFSRADQVSPGNPRVKGGLASAQVQNGNPLDALPLFDEAERGGLADSRLALDHGLAYDLVGDNSSAQRIYRQALSAGPNDEASRRLAVSLAISGDKKGSASALSPLLMRRDMAAWRARAFSLAIMGQTEEAVAVVTSTLPPDLSGNIGPYLRYMPRLTPAQQAAAANFGQFPRASEIGRDDPRLARYAPSTLRRPGLASADAGLIPNGEPLGRKPRGRDSRNAELIADRPAQPRVLAADEAPSRLPQDARSAALIPVPAMPVAASLPVQSAPRQPAPIQSAPIPAPIPAPLPVVKPVEIAIVAPVPQIPVPIAPPPAAVVEAPQPPPPPPRRPSLAEAFSDLSQPAVDVAPARGAVDIRRLKPAREGAANAVPEKPAAPSHPSRIWVQLATGRNKAALGFDWRRLSRQAEAVFRGKRGSISAWGQTQRLLTGPFDSDAAANAFLTQLRRADISGAFVWDSPAGQVVDALASK